MSSVPFNPVKKAPPPPPPADKSNLDPLNFIRLVSREGHEFLLDKECAKVSKLIKNYLANQMAALNKKDVIFDDADETKIIIRFPFTSAALLEKTVQYFYFKHRYEGDPENRPTFVVAHDMALDLIKVATLLQC